MPAGTLSACDTVVYLTAIKKNAAVRILLKYTCWICVASCTWGGKHPMCMGKRAFVTLYLSYNTKHIETNMKKTYIVAAMLLFVGAPLFGSQKQETQPALPTNNFFQSIGINGEYTAYDIEKQDLNLTGASIQYSRDIYTTKSGIVFTLRLSGSYGTGELEGDFDIPLVDEYGNFLGQESDKLTFDATAWGVMAGVDVNYDVNERCRLFVGPRVGYRSISLDESDGLKLENDELNATTYGFSIGIRYIFKDKKIGCEAGLNHLWNSWDAEDADTCTSNTIYAGVFYAF